MVATENFDVIVIGAGPSGAISSALLAQKGLLCFDVRARAVSTLFYR
jgi:flavin-dependent dehydrogenase